MNGAKVTAPGALTSGPRFSGDPQGSAGSARRVTQMSWKPTFPGRCEEKYNVSPSVEMDGETSAEGPLMGGGSGSGMPQGSCGFSRVVTQISASGLPGPVPRSK